jgi:Coenzyme PQQ synthesis protein D (PqqD)
MPISFSQKLTIAPDVLYRVIDDEAVLLNLKTELYIGLDVVGTRMWTVLHESASIEEAYNVLAREYDVAPDDLRADLENLVTELLEQAVVQVGPAEAPSGA